MSTSGVSIHSSIAGSAVMGSGGWSWEVLGWEAPGAGWSGRGFTEVPSDLGEHGMSGSDPIDSLGGDLTEGMP